MEPIDRRRLALGLGLAATLCVPAVAAPRLDEARVLAQLRAAHPRTTFTAVARTPIPNVYEAWMGTNVALVVAPHLRYFLFGRVFDTATMTDLTAPKLALAQAGAPDATASAEQDAATTRAQLAALPLGDAITTVRGTGARRLVVFSDPACPYCQRLHATLAALDDITLVTFPVPLLGAALPTAIWCAADRAHAWDAAMAGDAASRAALTAASTPCATPLARNLALAQQFGVAGTPTLFFADGSRAVGDLPRAALLAHLDAAAPGTAPRAAPPATPSASPPETRAEAQPDATRGQP